MQADDDTDRDDGTQVTDWKRSRDTISHAAWRRAAGRCVR